jgi:dienelactone hydrolase
MDLVKLFLLVLVCTQISCSQGVVESKQNLNPNESLNPPTVQYEQLKKGIILNSIVCRDTSQSYAAYLPSCYDTSKNYPLLIAFDPQANGHIPTKLYKDLCEKYNYIFVASNNSKNGLDAAQVDYITTTLLKEVKSRFKPDEKRIYLCGFSGGARVASGLALRGGITGLAACSAGPKLTQPLFFNFIGFAGDEDFNSNEMIELDRQLDLTNTNHQLILYEGKHAWPSSEIFEDAFLWFEFNAMRDKLIKSDLSFPNEYLNQEIQKIKDFESKQMFVAAYFEADKAARFLYGIVDCEPLLDARVRFEKMPQLRQHFTESPKVRIKEIELQNYYRTALQEKDFLWWKKEMDALINQSNSKGNTAEEQKLFRRCISYLGLLSYLSASTMLNQNQLPQAEHYLKIYEKIEPENPEVYYLKALHSAKQTRYAEVIQLLEKAVELGFSDWDRMQKEKDFIEADKSNLLQKIKSKH